MGTLNEELAATILRNFRLVQVTAESQWEEDLAARMNKPPVWSWTPGTFVFPEGLCCYCGGVMQSPAIWRTNNLQFLGSWKVVRDGDGVGHFEFEASHPHVHTGAICMGGDNRAAAVGDALFLAFNPLSTYFGPEADDAGNIISTTEQIIKAWFADRFDHVCGEGTVIKTMEGVDIRHAVAPEDGCHCHHCRMHRGEVLCPRAECGEWYEPRVGHGRFTCRVCGGTRRFCFQHQHQRYECSSCGDPYDLFDVRSGELDPNPYIKQCEDCQEWVCLYCLGEIDEGRRTHNCDDDEADDDDEAVDQHLHCYHNDEDEDDDIGRCCEYGERE